MTVSWRRFTNFSGWGMWSYLTARVHGRTVIELEKERNRGTAEAIRSVPYGGELIENEPGGRLRIIRMPGCTPISPPIMDWAVVQPALGQPPDTTAPGYRAQTEDRFAE